MHSNRPAPSNAALRSSMLSTASRYQLRSMLGAPCTDVLLCLRCVLVHSMRNLYSWARHSVNVRTSYQSDVCSQQQHALLSFTQLPAADTCSGPLCCPGHQSAEQSSSRSRSGTPEDEGGSGVSSARDASPQHLSATEQLSADLAAVESALSHRGSSGGSMNGGLQAAVTSAIAAASSSGSGSLSGGSGGILAAAASAASAGSGSRLSSALPSIDEQTARLDASQLTEQYAGALLSPCRQRCHPKIPSYPLAKPNPVLDMASFQSNGET